MLEPEISVKKSSLHGADFHTPQRSKSTMRHRYEAEARVIKAELGDIDSIRRKMGLSQREMCQLLLVDPSAWTRWNKGVTEVPPHIYRMIEWYLMIKEKHPSLASRFYERQAQHLDEHYVEKMRSLEMKVTADSRENFEMKNLIDSLERKILILEARIKKAAVITLAASLLFLFVSLLSARFG